MRLGVCYYPEHWPEDCWAQDAALMRASGLTRVRIGEFAWSRIEPEPRRFEWDWLDRAIAVLADAGLGIILGTPTATPPKWLVDRMPDMIAVDRDGKPRGFGSRRHYCFSHAGYRAEAARITTALAQRYGEHPAVVCWQTDNEYGCHDTVQSFSAAARDAFRLWLAERYGTIATLNAAWGNVFWSMEYRAFDKIELPNLTVTEGNPAHWLAFRRFSSDQVVSFNRAQVDILRRHSPGRDITHNAMGFYTGFDHHDLAQDLDVLGWDSYPLGFLEQFRFTAQEKRDFARQGHPDIAAFHHDLYRGCAKDGRWSVLEQQPGPVNWARHNPAPLSGMVRLWTLEALAHGAELVSYFRWRQFPMAQEQMHAGLLRTDGKPAPALAEVRTVADEIAEIGDPGAAPKHAALVFSYPSEWITQIQPQGEGCSALWAAFSCYTALRRLGLNVNIVAPDAPLDDYALVVVPCLPIVPDSLSASLGAFTGQIVIGPRTGSRSDDFSIPDTLPPGPLAPLVGGKVVLSETFAQGAGYSGDGWEITRWHDRFEGDVQAEIIADGGAVACWKSGRTRYCSGWPEGALIQEIVSRAARDAQLECAPLPAHIRRRTCAEHIFEFDYASAEVRITPNN
ncbi:beta-galactosidase [Qipengyuania marisflavi]|uniref:Beta-galactosidase n=2 Tax=Qipengyuania marisflavi TaxID=2486356 RepID=A0A5S3P0T2_9SPHN|nr:beta-galactosidase [Qipengyuania marisflavi]